MPSLLELGQGPLAGVELHRKGDEVEEDRSHVAEHAQEDHGLALEGRPQDRDRDAEARSRRDDRKHGGPQLEWGVVGGVLEGVRRLVGRDGHGGHAGVVCILQRKPDGVSPGVVAVRERAGRHLETHLLETVGVQDVSGAQRNVSSAGQLVAG